VSVNIRVPRLGQFRFIPICLFFGLFAISAVAQTNTVWTPGTSGSWSQSANWSSGVPNGNYNALISNGLPGASTVNLDINATVANLELDSGNTLNLLAGKKLTLQSSSPNVLNIGGTITIGTNAGISLGSGDTLLNNGTITLAGTGSFISGQTNTEVLVNDGTIEGHGTISGVSIQTDGFLGSIDASGGTLLINANQQGIAGHSFAVESGSKLVMTGGPLAFFDPSTKSISQVFLDVKGTLQFDNASIRSVAGFSGITLDGPNAKIVDQHGHNALGGGLDLNFASTLIVENGATLSTGTLSTNPQAGGQIFITNGSSVTASSISIEGPGADLELTNSTLKVAGGVHVCCGDVGSAVIVTGSQLNIGGDVQLGQFAGFSITNSNVKIGGDVKNDGGLFPASVQVNQSKVKIGGDLVLNQAAQSTISSSVVDIGKNLDLVANPFFQGCAPFCPPLGLNISNGSRVSVGGALNSAGNLTLDGTSSLTVKHGVVQSGGTSTIDGLLSVGTHGMNLQAGTLSGTGVIAGNLTSSGLVAPGDPLGVLTVTGNFTQTSSGTLLEQVSWLGGSSLLKILGNANLSGTLDISLVNGYTPQVGDSFILMTFGSLNGIFTSIDGLNISPTLDWVVFYDPHDIRIVVEDPPVATPEPASLLLVIVGLASLTVGVKLRR
jgi:hypothetical protein